MNIMAFLDVTICNSYQPTSYGRKKIDLRTCLISDGTSLPCVATGAAFFGAKSESESSELMVAKLRVAATVLIPLFAIGVTHRLRYGIDFFRSAGRAPARTSFNIDDILESRKFDVDRVSALAKKGRYLTNLKLHRVNLHVRQ
jgi:hypothetical protein